MEPTTKVVWTPMPRQHSFVSYPGPDALFGGARGGGKSDALLGDIAAHIAAYPDSARCLLVRRSYPELEELIERSRAIFPYVASGGHFNHTEKTWRWQNGAIFRMRHLQSVKDASLQQGFSYSLVAVDELTQWPDSRAIDMLRATLRSSAGIPTYFRATANPGGVGHQWVKARYIDPAPPFTPFTSVDTIGNIEIKVERVYIPSTLDQNLILMANDPLYWERIVASAAGNESLLRAWRYGDWDIAEGAAFADVWDPQTHILTPFVPPSSWAFFRSFDYGSSAPFSVGFWAVSNGEETSDGRYFPPHTMIRIGELYGWNGKSNEGLRLSYNEMGRMIRDAEEQVCNLYGIAQMKPGPADNQIFDVTNGSTIEDGLGMRWERSSKGPGSRATGLVNMRSRFYNALHSPNEGPGLYVFDTCRQFVRTIPVLPLNEKNNMDVDTDSEDHIYDETRYAISGYEPPTVAKVRALGF